MVFKGHAFIVVPFVLNTIGIASRIRPRKCYCIRVVSIMFDLKRDLKCRIQTAIHQVENLTFYGVIVTQAKNFVPPKPVEPAWNPFGTAPLVMKLP